MVLRILKVGLGLLTATVMGLAGYMFVAPPDLFRVATNYSAKIVCSNVFVAGRNADEVLAVDVQAPGHPLLKQISIRVDEDRQTVQAWLFGVFAPATSQFRPGLGCTNVHNGRLSAPTLSVGMDPQPGVWPNGNDVVLSRDAEVLAALSDDALLGVGYRAAVVVHNGRIIGEAYGEGFDADTPLLGWSMTKTVTAGLIGTLIQSESLDLNTTLGDSYRSWNADGRAAITIEDMLGMESGLQWNEGYGNVSDVTRMLYLVDDMAGFAADLGMDAEIGTVFNYSSGTSTMLSRVWQDSVGEDSLSYPRRALFDPLGMTSAVMETDAQDTFVGSSYMYATARDWARFGQLLLQQGVWGGQRILPARFTDWMFAPVEASNGLYAQGHLWLESPGELPPFEDAVWLQGHDGQFIGIFPSHELVVVRMGLTPSRHGYSSLPLAKALIAALDNQP